MRKSFILSLVLLLPMAISAQSTWELPTSNTQTSKETPKKADKKQKLTKEESDAPYLAGAVPEIDDKVVFSADISTNGLTVDEEYQKAYDYMDDLAKEDCQSDKSKVAIVDPQEHSVVGTYTEKLIFRKRALELDFCSFNYVIIATCTEGNVHVAIERLTYDYAFGNDVEHVTAEETITDKLMLTADGTKLKRVNAKFRKTTVNRMREIISGFRKALE